MIPMQFMLLLTGKRTAETAAPAPELMAAMEAFNQSLRDAGAWVDAQGLAPTSEGFRTENTDGAITVVEGPFTERDEVLYGYWVITAASLEKAVGWANKVPFEADPTADGGQVEVRPFFELDDFPQQENESGWREDEEAMRAQQPPAVDENKLRYFMAFDATADSEAGVMPSEEQLAEMGGFIQELHEAGIFIAGDGLQPSSKGARVRYEGGRRTVTDGPFAETKEMVAGYSVVQVDSREQAVEIAVRGAKINGRSGGDVRLIL
jgi:hypothetical protein